MSGILPSLQEFQKTLKVQLVEGTWMLKIRPEVEKQGLNHLYFQTDLRGKRVFHFTVVCETATIAPGQQNDWIAKLQFHLSFYSGTDCDTEVRVLPNYFVANSFDICTEPKDGAN